MAYDPLIHHRRSIRLKGYDYTKPGAYFITINAFHRSRIFGVIESGMVRLNACGEIARAEWLKTAEIRREIALDEFVIMPDHMHGIIIIMESDNNNDNDNDSVEARLRRASTIEQFSKPVAGSIPTIIRAYKSAVTYQINHMRGTPGAPVWQGNYWERIIRNESALSRIREYIRRNLMRWMDKQDHSL